MFRFAFAAALSAGAVVSAAVPANSVVSFSQGAGVTGFSNPAVATGLPDALTGEMLGFPNILSPFSPAYENDEIVGIGRGGQLRLQFSQPIEVIAGREFGVISNIGLVDAAFPAGQNTNPASTFSAAPRIADVAVSANGVDFIAVGRHTFEQPANYFANAGDPYLTAAPANPAPADFGVPFAGTLSTFDGLNWAQTLAALGGSGGGTWIDVDPVATGLASFSFISFSIPQDGISGSDDRLFIDAVVANNAAVPEPSTALALAVAGVAAWLRRR